jgi:hypothetical protein
MASTILIGSAFVLVALLIVAFLLMYLLPVLTRQIIKSSGELANAVILEVNHGKNAVYSGDRNLTAQELIIKLEVQPANGPAYQAQDRFMANTLDMMKLRAGCDLQVRVSKSNPAKVVCLPETIRASANAPLESRASLAMASLVANNGKASPEDVRKAFEAQGIRQRPQPEADDPKAKLEKLKDMLDSGLITQTEFEAKKADILAKL